MSPIHEASLRHRLVSLHEHIVLAAVQRVFENLPPHVDMWIVRMFPDPHMWDEIRAHVALALLESAEEIAAAPSLIGHAATIAVGTVLVLHSHAEDIPRLLKRPIAPEPAVVGDAHP